MNISWIKKNEYPLSYADNKSTARLELATFSSVARRSVWASYVRKGEKIVNNHRIVKTCFSDGIVVM